MRGEKYEVLIDHFAFFSNETPFSLDKMSSKNNERERILKKRRRLLDKKVSWIIIYADYLQTTA